MLLFGGGLALAKGFEASGLSAAIAGALTQLDGLPTLVVILTIALCVTFLTEVTSNTAITTLLMPILAPFAKAADLPPETVMLPAALAASCAFMLPVATPPNVVVYGSGKIPIAFMARTGVWLNLAGVLIVGLWVWLVTRDPREPAQTPIQSDTRRDANAAEGGGENGLIRAVAAVAHRGGGDITTRTTSIEDDHDDDEQVARAGRVRMPCADGMS